MVEILKTNRVFGKQMATILVSDQIKLAIGMIISKDGNNWKINGVIIEAAGGEKNNEHLKNNSINNIWECELLPINHMEELQVGNYRIQDIIN
jgi:hypothetical protein